MKERITQKLIILDFFFLHNKQQISPGQASPRQQKWLVLLLSISKITLNQLVQYITSVVKPNDFTVSSKMKFLT